MNFIIHHIDLFGKANIFAISMARRSKTINSNIIPIKIDATHKFELSMLFIYNTNIEVHFIYKFYFWKDISYEITIAKPQKIAWNKAQKKMFLNLYIYIFK